VKNGQIAMCPSNLAYRTGYGWNYPHMPYRTFYGGGAGLAAYNYPAQAMVFCDSNSYVWVYCPIHYPAWSDGYCRVSDRHNDGANCGYLDGHSKWEKRTNLLSTSTDNQYRWVHLN
jgi:prepilin-type processing-associated H-X9-DG protein